MFALVPPNSNFSSPGDVESRDQKRSKCRTGPPSPTRSADLSPGVIVSRPSINPNQQSHCELDFARDKFNTAGKTLAYTNGRIDYQKYLINTAAQKLAELDDQIMQLTAQRDELHDGKVDNEEAADQMICVEQIQMQQEEEARIELDAEKKRHAGVKFRFKLITAAFVAMEYRKEFGFKRNSNID